MKEVERNKKVVFTVITGNYDKNYEPDFKKSSEIDYLLFTDNKNKKSKFWDVKYLNRTQNPILMNRELKIYPFKILKDYDQSVYVDGRLKLLNCLMPIFKENVNYDWAGPKHRFGSNVIDEAFRCFDASKISFSELRNFLLTNIGLDFNNLPFPECGLIFRKHNDEVKEFSRIWKELFTIGPNRDQMHWQKAYLKKKINFSYLDFSFSDENPFTKIGKHKSYKYYYLIKKAKILIRNKVFG